MTIAFTKMHGLGNDYHFIDVSKHPIEDPAGLSRAMSHRHLGAGADGIILVMPGEEHEFRMRIFNADGSEAEACGNGIRCFAKYVFERGMTRNTEFTIETLAGPNRVELRVENGTVETVRSNMGRPRFERNEIPMEGPAGRVIEEPLDIGGETVQVTCANIGNPHAVIFVEDATKIDLTVLGPKIENHPKFPERTNVEFVNIIDRNNIVMRIWERGSGITQACGTGACACCVASVLTGKTQRDCTAHLPGGDLQLAWNEQDNHVYMTGPAVEVFQGTWPT